jgi:hypothetical protein
VASQPACDLLDRVQAGAHRLAAPLVEEAPGPGTNDFERAARFFDTLYASNRLKLPLDGILLIGY